MKKRVKEKELIRKCLIEFNNKYTNQITEKQVNDDTEHRFTLLDMQKFVKYYLKEKSRLYGNEEGLTVKETIDYQIYAVRKAKEENLKSWAYSMSFVVIFLIAIFSILKSCGS